jgi:hypothetical protein
MASILTSLLGGVDDQAIVIVSSNFCAAVAIVGAPVGL